MTHDVDLLHADEQARIDALDVSRSFIVQAPAGSGKTELLIQRYLRLLAVVDDPEEILAITFTRKAAAEMQFRVLDALLGARRGEIPAEAHERVTADAALAALERDAEKDWRIIENPGRMRIQTLDSLNASIARMQPVTGSSAVANVVADEGEMKALYRNAAAATLDWLGEQGALRGAVEEVLLHVDNSTDIYNAYVARMLETRDQWLPFVGTGEQSNDAVGRLRGQLERNLAETVSQHLRRTSASMPRELLPELLPLASYAGRNLTTAGADDNPISMLESMDALPSSDSDGLDAWLGIAELLLTRTGGWRKRVNKNQGFPPGDRGQKDSFHDLLEGLAEKDELRTLLADLRSLPPVRYSDEQWRVLLSLFQLLPLAVAELQRLFATLRVTDYIEIAIGADEALGTAERPGDIALLLDYQVRHVLIDEMQDTSRAQYRLVESLTGGWVPGDGRTLFCVGDPMQSIYRFRNAEVAQFLLAKEKGVGDIELESLLLRQNFRSAKFLVHWFNTVFPMVLPPNDEPSRGAVSYAEAVPARMAEGDCQVYPLFGGDPEAEAEQGLRIIERTLEDFPDDEMAILVRGRTQLAALLPKLRYAGIPYQSVDIDRLTDLPEIIDALALTRALAHPCDRLAWLALLRSPWIGWSWSDLHALVYDEPESTVWELLTDQTRLERLSADARQSFDVARAALESAIRVSRSKSLRDRVEETWLRLGGPAILQIAESVENVYRFLDVLEKIEVAGTLSDVADLEQRLDLERVSNNVRARLQIMTMHRAKGLQFDHVLLYGLGRKPRRADKSVLSWFDMPDEHGDEEKIISPVGRRSELENDPIHRYIELRENQKDHYEHGRLLYVACTRARKTLHLVGHTGVSADGESMRPPQAQSLLRLLWPAVVPVFEQAFKPGRGLPEKEAGNAWRMPERRRIEPAWTLPGVEAVPGQAVTDVSTDHGDPVEFHWVGAEARLAGTVVHRWLQLAADGEVNFDTEDPSLLRDQSERWLREMGVGPVPMDAVVTRVETALAGVVSDSRGRWLLNCDGHAELALTGVVDGRLESGVIDRVCIDADGSHWIVDYKTSTHEGGNLAGFLQAEAERYQGQLKRYAELYRAYAAHDVRCALYFPLLQQFVEVPV